MKTFNDIIVKALMQAEDILSKRGKDFDDWDIIELVNKSILIVEFNCKYVEITRSKEYLGTIIEPRKF